MIANLHRLNQNCLRITSLFCTSLLAIVIAIPSYAQKNPGKGRSTFTVRLMNKEATAKEAFRFNASLYNGSGRTQIYELTARAPEGWNTIFRTEGSQIAGVKLDSGKTQAISVEFNAAPMVKPGKYKIPIIAVGDNDSLRVEVEAVVKGNYSLELSTPSGRLSDDITEGKSKELQLVVKNTGTLALDGLDMSAQTPTKWNATFEPSKIERLDPGQTANVTATLNVPDKTISGDYVSNFSVKNSHANASAAFRMTVRTSLLSGWIGILVILLAIGTVYYLIRKYGRR